MEYSEEHEETGTCGRPEHFEEKGKHCGCEFESSNELFSCYALYKTGDSRRGASQDFVNELGAKFTEFPLV